MWDGFHFLANRRAWDALPADARIIVARELDRSAIEERTDVAALNAQLRDRLKTGGLTFNDVDPAPFRETLKRAGFYAEWRGKYGDEAWRVLEDAVGALS